MDNLLTVLGVAGVNFVMGLPGADDIMLNYQSTSFHDSHYLRQVLKVRPAPEFEAWLEKMHIMEGGLRLEPANAGNALVAGQLGRMQRALGEGAGAAMS
jgi:ethanolamine ammonia-lyase large subunit